MIEKLWVCLKCGAANKWIRDECRFCETERPRPYQAGQPAKKGEE